MPKNEQNFFKNFSDLKKEVSKSFQKNKMVDLQKQVKKRLLKAEKDLIKVVGKDVNIVAKKFKKEKSAIVKYIEKTVQDEVKKAKKFLDTQIKDLNSLQKKLEGYIETKKSSKNSGVKKATKKKKVAKKSTTKKAVATKTARAKKVSKKSAATPKK